MFGCEQVLGAELDGRDNSPLPIVLIGNLEQEFYGVAFLVEMWQ